MPLNKYKVYGFSQQVQPIAWSPPSAENRVQSATFSGIEALGGLIMVRFTGDNAVAQDGIFSNNDFNLYATVTCHSWTPMKR